MIAFVTLLLFLQQENSANLPEMFQCMWLVGNLESSNEYIIIIIEIHVKKTKIIMTYQEKNLKKSISSQ